jgi:hypothetical protein
MHFRQPQFFSVSVMALALSMQCFAQARPAEASPLSRFAGTWKEVQSRRKSTDMLIFRRDAQGNPEEVLAYETLINPVRFDGKPYPVDSLKNTEAIAWKQLDKSRFERTFFEGGRPLATMHFQILGGGQTLSVEGVRLLPDGRQNVSTFVYRRTRGRVSGPCGDLAANIFSQHHSVDREVQADGGSPDRSG